MYILQAIKPQFTMKRITLLTKTCIFLMLSVVLIGCTNSVTVHSNFLGETIEGSKKVISETRSIPKSFDKIQVSSNIDVELQQSDDYEIIVEADDNIIDYLLTEVNGGTLKIHFDNISVKNIEEAKVYVKMPHISELRASSSSEIKVVNPIESDHLVLRANSTSDMKLSKITAKSVVIGAGSSAEIEIGEIYVDKSEIESSATADIKIKIVRAEKVILSATSSSEIIIDKVFTDKLKAQVTSTADIEINTINANHVSLDATSSGDIEIKGTTKELEAKTSSTANIDAKELRAGHVTVEASSSSEVAVYPIMSLKATANSSADIYYYNQPETIDKDTSSAGSVEKK